MSKRVFLIVLDSVGIGEAPDADRFDDVGCDTFGTCVKSGKLHVPNMSRLGIYNIDGTSFADKKEDVTGCYARMQEQSAGKDTTMGHWEISGVISPKPLPTYPNGFPKVLVDGLEELSGRPVLCNQAYSGTEVIRDYGKEAVESGGLILYTSADSVFQIAAHEDVVPVAELYEICRKARAMLCGEYAIGRVIARPFVGNYPDYERTVNRHDFSLEPPKKTVLDALKEAGLDTIGVGKIYDIFAGRGIGETYANQGNNINMEKTFEICEKAFHGLCFVNLVDFDMIYGHRNDIEGYVNALNEVDIQLGQLMDMMKEDDLLMITADHGCDPGFRGTDHSREYTPCLSYGKTLKQGVNLGQRNSFADIAQTIAEYLEVPYEGDGESFLYLMNN
jgi:phosphopentomutase